MTFCELPLWEICIPRIVQAEEILIGCFVECQSNKKVGGRRSVEGLYQALFFVSPRLNVSPSETKIEPDRRLFIAFLMFFKNFPNFVLLIRLHAGLVVSSSKLLQNFG